MCTTNDYRPAEHSGALDEVKIIYTVSVACSICSVYVPSHCVPGSPCRPPPPILQGFQLNQTCNCFSELTSTVWVDSSSALTSWFLNQTVVQHLLTHNRNFWLNSQFSQATSTSSTSHIIFHFQRLWNCFSYLNLLLYCRLTEFVKSLIF